MTAQFGSITIPSGIVLRDPPGSLRRFCEGEYVYYDAIEFTHPDRVGPLDVLVTVAMNSSVNTAVKVQGVHQGMAQACDPILAEIPEDMSIGE
jgi:hypothetical protein